MYSSRILFQLCGIRRDRILQSLRRVSVELIRLLRIYLMARRGSFI